ncbi:MAG: DUF721 domain-containing protein [Pseudomonadales bacterium]|nr:DUF721 domain-containing protein [Pseudomonadales bacterium]
MSRDNYSAETEISRLINARDSALARLIDRAQKILSLQSKVSARIPKDCQAFCHFLSYRDGLLKLQADSATWATRLRFQQPQIMAQLKQLAEFHDIEQIRILVRPQYVKPNPKITAKPISPAAADHLRTIADTLDQPELSAALRHIIEPK